MTSLQNTLAGRNAPLRGEEEEDAAKTMPEDKPSENALFEQVVEETLPSEEESAQRLSFCLVSPSTQELCPCILPEVGADGEHLPLTVEIQSCKEKSNLIIEGVGEEGSKLRLRLRCQTPSSDFLQIVCAPSATEGLWDVGCENLDGQSVTPLLAQIGTTLVPIVGRVVDGDEETTLLLRNSGESDSVLRLAVADGEELVDVGLKITADGMEGLDLVASSFSVADEAAKNIATDLEDATPTERGERNVAQEWLDAARKTRERNRRRKLEKNGGASV